MPAATVNLDAFGDGEQGEPGRCGEDRAEPGGALGGGAPGAISAVVLDRLPGLVEGHVRRVVDVDEHRDVVAAGERAGRRERLMDDLGRGFQRFGLELQIENRGYRHSCSLGTR